MLICQLDIFIPPLKNTRVYFRIIIKPRMEKDNFSVSNDKCMRRPIVPNMENMRCDITKPNVM